MEEMFVAIPLAIAIGSSAYVYLSFRKLIKELPSTKDPLFGKFRELATLTHENWIKSAKEITELVEGRKSELVDSRPEIVTLSFIIRQQIGSLGISPAPINPAKTAKFYETVGRRLEAYVNAQTSGKTSKATDEMLRLQAFMATH